MKIQKLFFKSVKVLDVFGYIFELAIYRLDSYMDQLEHQTTSSHPLLTSEHGSQLYI